MKEVLLPNECSLDTNDLIIIKRAIETYVGKADETLFKINHMLRGEEDGRD